MSLIFSDPTNKSGICELIDANVGSNLISYPLLDKVRDINLALDKIWSIILQASGKWQFDDSGHTKDPIIKTDLVSGQRDYHFISDEQGNLILDIYRVMVANADGIFYDLDAVDQQTKDLENLSMVDGQERTGNPTKYDKTGNGIFLDLIPNYNYTKGLKLFINREAFYFTVSDTTKKPGFAGIFHEYLALRPSYQYAYRKVLANAKALQTEMLLMEQKIEEYYGQRNKDERPIMSSKKFNFR